MNLRPCALGPALSLERAKRLSRYFADARALPEATTRIGLGAAGPIARWKTEFLFDYRVFPAAIMRFEAEWRKHGRGMAVGDIIVQRAVIPPIGFGFCLEFAVRVCALLEEERRRGFAYETLSGHAESGLSAFYIEEIEGELFFTIHTFSQPGHWTSRLARRFFTLPYQAWCTRRALQHVRRMFRAENGLLPIA
jgi:uncharacterized protein (UPF0548 family)